MNNDNLKNKVENYWDAEACGTHLADAEKFSKEYFNQIEDARYRIEPEIHAFAQFSRYKGKKILEIGTGAGTDFIQWVRVGAKAHGIDLTQESVDHVNKRLELFGEKAEKIQRADCENIPYPDNTFDLVYSWGVIHHSPDTQKAMAEAIRVCAVGGTCKIMIYHRYSLLSFFFWIKYALLRGKPWLSLSKVLYNHMESYGTKAYNTSEIKEMLKGQAVEIVDLKPVLTFYDRLGRFGNLYQKIAKCSAWIFGGDRVGWFYTINLRKIAK